MDITLFAITFCVSVLMHYGVQKIFIKYNRFDDINHRSSHNTLATRTGGIGIFLSVLIISLYYYFQAIELFNYSLFIPLGIMLIIGVYDDLYNADFKLKFLLQIIVAKILIDQGYVISNFYGFFGFYEVPWLLAQASTVFVFLLVVNAINFIDGIDGLAITEVIKIILIIEYFSKEISSLAPLGLMTICAILPLYYFNFKKKRKVFLGDGGSMLLGALISVYIFNVLDEEFMLELSFNKTVFVILSLLYPLTDLLRVFFIRLKSGGSPFVADKRHIHHFLNKKSKFKLSTVLIILLSELLITFIFFFFS